MRRRYAVGRCERFCEHAQEATSRLLRQAEQLAHPDRMHDLTAIADRTHRLIVAAIDNQPPQPPARKPALGVLIPDK